MSIIRIALLQRKTLIETKKNHALKCLKWHYLTVRSMKNVAVLTEDGAFALFFWPFPGMHYLNLLGLPKKKNELTTTENAITYHNMLE